MSNTPSDPPSARSTPIAAADLPALNAAKTALLAAAQVIVKLLAPTLSASHRAGIEKTLHDDGLLALEVSNDQVGTLRIAMTLVTADGRRIEVCSVHALGA